MEPKTFVIHFTVWVRRLQFGETVKINDFYLSTSGQWSLAPVFGFVLTENNKTKYARICQAEA